MPVTQLCRRPVTQLCQPMHAFLYAWYTIVLEACYAAVSTYPPFSGMPVMSSSWRHVTQQSQPILNSWHTTFNIFHNASFTMFNNTVIQDQMDVHDNLFLRTRKYSLLRRRTVQECIHASTTRNHNTELTLKMKTNMFLLMLSMNCIRLMCSTCRFDFEILPQNACIRLCAVPAELILKSFHGMLVYD